ncbi:MAG: glycosyltransferase family 39 protein [Candidatus Competibacteraceae bacterium]|nr:MAG: glycosyltransferase family 39 protein [Candidatus Competibacteraceae bacterium]
MPTETEKPSINESWLLLIGLLASIVDLVIFFGFFKQSHSLVVAHITGFLSAAAIQYVLIQFWLTRANDFRSKSAWTIEFFVIALLMLFLRGGILSSLVSFSYVPSVSVMYFCIFISSILYFSVNFAALHLEFNNQKKSINKWRYYYVGLILYSIILRLLYLSAPELFYEEAYYWNYAMHLDIGYLDHPPMVAWIISLFTKLMGNNEFAVRFGAFICWFITAISLYKLTGLACNKSKDIQTILLIAVLPAYFAVGWAMTPDAPLVACWAMALYFFYQALIRESRVAWIGIGLAIGLGMLAKYTIALLGIAACAFILIDRDARKWLMRPEPYAAIAIALIIFLPVIIWNANHEWVSFLYQSRGRVTDQFEFSLPYLMGTIILIITPTGFLSLIAILLYRKTILSGGDAVLNRPVDTQARRGYTLLATLTLLPVSVFVLLSLFRETKFHWTAPCWLGIVPYMALTVTGKLRFGLNRLFGWIQHAWPATIIICLLLYGVFLHYLALGFPGVSYPYNYHLLGWNDFGHEIEALVNRVEYETGEKILVVGMDRNRVASGLAFYRTKAIESSNEKLVSNPAVETSSWHLFGGNGLMYERWFPIDRQQDKTLLLVGRNRADLASESVFSHIKQAQEIKEIKINKNGQQVGLYYYRMVKGYRSQPTIDKNSANN